MRPSASTTVAALSESHVRPNRRPTTPWPPPSVSPLIPTVGQVPTGITAPAAATPAATSITLAPASIVAVPAPVRERVPAVAVSAAAGGEGEVMSACEQDRPRDVARRGRHDDGARTHVVESRVVGKARHRIAG